MSDTGVTVVIQALSVGSLALLYTLSLSCSPSSATLSNALHTPRSRSVIVQLQIVLQHRLAQPNDDLSPRKNTTHASVA